MIVVDTSVWIAHFRGEKSAAVAKLRALPDANDVVVGDIILMECLQGARDERHAAKIESTMRAFEVAAMLSVELAIEGARHYRSLRKLGLTPRKTIDVMIATFCIARGFALLHQDRDFDAMARIGLRMI